MALWDDVKEVVVEQLNVSPHEVKSNTKFRDLGADNLDIIELVLQLEKKFDVHIPDSELPSISSVQEATAYLEKVFNDN